MRVLDSKEIAQSYSQMTESSDPSAIERGNRGTSLRRRARVLYARMRTFFWAGFVFTGR